MVARGSTCADPAAEGSLSSSWRDHNFFESFTDAKGHTLIEDCYVTLSIVSRTELGFPATCLECANECIHNSESSPELRLRHVDIQTRGQTISPVARVDISFKYVTGGFHERMQRAKVFSHDYRIRRVRFEGDLFCYWSGKCRLGNDGRGRKGFLSRSDRVVRRQGRQRNAASLLACRFLGPVSATGKRDLESLAVLGERDVRDSKALRDRADRFGPDFLVKLLTTYSRLFGHGPTASISSAAF